ncbi:MAG: T9SS type A sorting domain-containing protein, partial [Flavobacteriales bacterium]|nr:T9SS type A sorting domain-containing protein [Flavobacteriales bacterium]
DADNQVFAAYVSGVGTNGGSNYIPSFQGFWIKASGLSPQLTAKESVKAAQDVSFFKSGIPIDTLAGIIRFSISGGSNSFKDETVLRFMEFATIDYEGEVDAYQFTDQNSDSPQISTVIPSGADMAISTVSEINESMEIPIRVSVPTAGSYTISATNFTNIYVNSCILLEDLETGIYTDLKVDSSYTFNTVPGNGPPRFLLHVGQGKILANPEVCLNPGDWKAVAYAPASSNAQVLWQNMLGDTVSFIPNFITSDTNYTLPPGQYTYKITDQAGICPSTTDTIFLNYSINPEVELGNDTTICAGTNLQLDAGSASHYLWSDGSTNQTLIVDQTDTYSITITDHFGCSDTDSLAVVVDICSDIQEIDNNISVLLFPNPSVGQIQLEIVSQQEGEITATIFNGMGQVIYNSSNIAKITALDLNHLSSGVYTIRISIGELESIQRIVIM